MHWQFHRPDRARLVIDLETYSVADLRRTGAYAYAEHPSTDVHCVAWEVKGGTSPGKGLWLPGQPIPPKILDHIRAPELPIIAHNWWFEWCIWQFVLTRKHGWPLPGRDRWSCTMARALYHGLPASLDLLSQALQLDHKKDKTQRQNMLRLARPRMKDAEGNAVSWWHEDKDGDGPEKLAALHAYCVQDVAAESEADDKLPELPAAEREVFQLDALINSRGVRIDFGLVDRLATVTDEELGRLNARMDQLTNGTVRGITQTARLTWWITQTTGITLASLDKAHMPEALEATKGTEAYEPVAIRQEGAKSSTAKLASMCYAAAPSDDRARGLLQYYGAGRTGRWAGRLVQPQNMPRPLLKDKELEAALAFVLRGNGAEDLFKFFSPTVMEVVSSCLRGCLVAAPGHLFVSVDASQIEARMVAWLAGQQDILDVFARGEDVYTYTAKRIGSDNRQLGKVLVLACGFGMGGPKFAHTASLYGIQLTESAAQKLVWDWREANAAIAQSWTDLGEAFKRAVHASSGTWERLGKLQIGKTGKAVRIRLPSNRELVYQAVDIGKDALGRDEIGYWGVDQLTNQWRRLRTYGGKLMENVTQAAARDVLAHNMLCQERAGQRLVLSVHDESLAESPEARAVADLQQALAIFRTPPRWAPDLPVGAEGWIGPRYRK